MFYKNLKKGKQVKDYKLTFASFKQGISTNQDDEIMPHTKAKLTYNFNASGGSLQTGNGFKNLCLPRLDGNGEREIVPEQNQNFKKVWLYKYYNSSLGKFVNQLVFYSQSGNIYTCNIKSNGPLTTTLLGNVFSAGVPNAINYKLNSKDTLIFSSATNGMWKYTQNEVASEVQSAPHIKSMCLHYERLFGIVGDENNRLSFSSSLDPTDWSESLSGGGFIDMQDERGALKHVVSFKDYIYVFRDYGISRVSAYGDQSDFSVTHLFKSSVKLYGNTVTVCGNKIFMLARDGVHIFDGYSSHKLNLGIDKLFEGVDNENSTGAFYNNKLYFALKLNFPDSDKVGCENYVGGYVNNALLEIDPETYEINITRGVDISSLLALEDEETSKLVATFNGEHCGKLGELVSSGKIFGTTLTKKWVSPKSSMGFVGKQKIIKECFIKTNTNLTISVETKNGIKNFSASPKNAFQRVKLGAVGEQVQISFSVLENGENINISCPQITIGVVL